MKRVVSEKGKHIIRMSKLGEKNGMWKGDDVGYNGVHWWVKYRLPKPNFCQKCDRFGPVDLANKSGNYLRDLSDWEYICRRCHMLSDGRMMNLKGCQYAISGRLDLSVRFIRQIRHLWRWLLPDEFYN